MPAADHDHDHDRQLGLVGAAVAIVAWGASSVLVKGIDMDAIAISFYRFTTYALLMIVLMTARSGTVPLSGRILRASMAGGICLGLDVILFFTAVKNTNIVNATTIGAMQPLVLAGFAVRMFGERIHPREIVAAAVALTGVVIIVVESAGTPEWSGAGDLAAVGALFSWSGYFLFSKRSKGVLSSSEYTVGTGVWTAAIALPAGFLFQQDMSVPSSDDWLPLLVLVLGAGVLGHSAMNWSLVRIPLWIGSMFTLLIPVVSSIAAWIWLDEALTGVQLAAMGLVIAALSFVVHSQSRTGSSAVPATAGASPAESPDPTPTVAP
jgi:drug/metabolite transporter (DMT)-like permease